MQVTYKRLFLVLIPPELVMLTVLNVPNPALFSPFPTPHQAKQNLGNFPIGWIRMDQPCQISSHLAHNV